MKRTEISFSWEASDFIKEDVLLFTRNGSQPNVMTLTFKSFGIILGDPCLTIFVNSKRFTSELLETNPEFTICRGGRVPDYIGGCGKYTGRDTEKISLFSMETLPGQLVSVPVLKECKVSYECKLVEYSESVIMEGYKMYIGQIEGVFLHENVSE